MRVVASKNRFVSGMYRRHIKTIRYLGQLDKLYGAPAITRGWNTVLSVVRSLKEQDRKAADKSRRGLTSH